MPTNLKEFYLFIIIFTILIFSIGIFIGFRETEAFEIFANSIWEVERITLNNKDVTSQYDCLNIWMLYGKKSKLVLPREKMDKNKGRGTWQYYRTGWFDGNIKFNVENNRFAGKYAIDVLGHQHPKVIRLYSDSIELYLKEEYHTFFQEPTMKTNYFDCK